MLKKLIALSLVLAPSVLFADDAEASKEEAKVEEPKEEAKEEAVTEEKKD